MRKICPQQAISYHGAGVGKVRSGFSKRLNNSVHIGDLNIGSTRATYLINEMVRGINRSRPVVIDGPPGNSCAAVAAIKPADLVVLVVEPTPFGFHDMQQTEQILIEMDKDYLIIANKALSDESVDAFSAPGRDNVRWLSRLMIVTLKPTSPEKSSVAASTKFTPALNRLLDRR